MSLDPSVRQRIPQKRGVMLALCLAIAGLAIVVAGLSMQRSAELEDGKSDEAAHRELEAQRKILERWEREAELTRP
jgi:hypothetical protein